jgi:hypothetical protein
MSKKLYNTISSSFYDGLYGSLQRATFSCMFYVTKHGAILLPEDKASRTSSYYSVCIRTTALLHYLLQIALLNCKFSTVAAAQSKA